MKKFHEIKLPYTTHCAIPAALLLVTCLVILAFVVLPGREPLLPPLLTDGHGGGNLSSCNIFKGEWVPDPCAPRYTTETCPVIHGNYDCMRCLAANVTDLTLRYSLRMAFQTALRAAADAPPGAGRRRSRSRRTVVVRTLSPSHYENGTWNEDGDCALARSLRRGVWEMKAVEKDMYAIQAEEFGAARRASEGTRMLLLDATEAMALRPDAHPSKYRPWQPDRFNVLRDCLHWCLPGAMDACNDMLLHMLLHYRN
ncbi:unnamed protein product [Miscanthus lutarioriparius]|uniref:Trichome birefringence-like C-terminal domain-containing protein n=1 Tax=Miscanthus lutarioriparius TaxID=422564 RepID=A0A811SAC7_9POAL|nr:unnamed protein product [Miscanthus lutarioriparius]